MDGAEWIRQQHRSTRRHCFTSNYWVWLGEIKLLLFITVCCREKRAVKRHFSCIYLTFDHFALYDRDRPRLPIHCAIPAKIPCLLFYSLLTSDCACFSIILCRNWFNYLLQTLIMPQRCYSYIRNVSANRCLKFQRRNLLCPVNR